MSLTLRPYQNNLIHDIRQSLRTHNSVAAIAPTGTGKTALASKMLGNAWLKKKRSFFIVHKKILVRQSSEAFQKADIPHGFVTADEPINPFVPIHICSIETLKNRLKRVNKPDLIVWDECIVGNSLLYTDKGLIKISDVVAYGASLVLSYKDGIEQWKKITAWRKTGIKKTLKIVTSNANVLHGTENHLILTKSGWKTIGQIIPGEEVLCLPKEKKHVSWVRSWVTRLLDILIKEQKHPGSLQIIQQSNIIGQSIRQKFFVGSALNYLLRKMAVMAKKLLEWLLVVCPVWLKLKSLLNAMEGRSQVKNGLMGLLPKRLHGGFVTMAIYFLKNSMQLFTQRVLAKREEGLFGDFWQPDMVQQTYMNTKEDIFISVCQEKRLNAYLKKLPHIFPNACAINWEKVERIEEAGSEEVYDISVEDTECFFADNILVHNCHHCMASGYKQIRDYYPDVKHVGLTATPRRTDGQGLIGAFEDMVQAPPVKWFIDEGYLCPYKVFAPYVPDTKGIKIENNDYAKADLEKLMDSSSIVGNVVSHYREFAHKKKAVVFAVTITHSQHLVESFKRAGYAAAHIDGYMEEEELFPILQAFRKGDLDVLVNIGLAGEGFDLPDIEVVIKARPTKSEITDVQQTGRALRPVYAPGYDLSTKEGRKAAIAASPKPYAIILDHAGNTHRHGLPCDERNWSLHGEERRHKRDSDNISSVKMKTCPNPKCYYMHPPAPQCPNCGHIYEITGDIPKELQGKLTEIDPNTFTRQIKMDDRPGVLESLIEIGKSRGEKDPVKWAARVYTEGQVKRG